MMQITKIIAGAIKKADSSFLFENYDHQAANVLKALKENGLVIVPKEPTESMLEGGKRAINYGAQRPTDLLKAIFKEMTESI